MNVNELKKAYVILGAFLNAAESNPVLMEATQKTLPNVQFDDRPKQMNIESLIEYLNENGISATKSSIYKKVHYGQLPYKKFSKQLIFDKSEIDQWITDSIYTPSRYSDSDIELSLSKAAIRKL